MKKLLFLLLLFLVGCRAATTELTTTTNTQVSTLTTSTSEGSENTTTTTTTNSTTTSTTSGTTSSITTITTSNGTTTTTTTTITSDGTTITTTTTVNPPVEGDIDALYALIDEIVFENTPQCEQKIAYAVSLYKTLSDTELLSANQEKIKLLFHYQREFAKFKEAVAEDLFFSEYYEGEKNNNTKYIEIFNGTGRDVNLNGYTVEMYKPGEKVANQSLVFTDKQIIKSNDVFVIAHSNSNPDVLKETDATSTVCYFSGKHTLVLKKNNGMIDIIGKIGANNDFNVGSDTLTDNTVIRNKDISRGNAVFTETEWTSMGMTSALNVGKHEFNSTSYVNFEDYLFFENKLQVNQDNDFNQNLYFCDVNDFYIAIKNFEILNEVDFSKLGVQTLVMIATDYNGNLFYIREEFNIVDEVAPVIKLKKDVSTKFLLNTEINLLQLLEITDNYDQNIILESVVIAHEIDNTKLGYYQVLVSYTDSNSNIGEFEFTVQIINGEEKTDKLKNYMPFVEAFPSTGLPKLLVIPIGFSGYDKSATLLTKIQTAFNGTSDQTGFESLNSFYSKSSYGSLNVTTTVLDWYTPTKSKTYYENYVSADGYDDGSILLLEEACAYYESKINFNDYDYDKDGYIDSVYLIYNCPVSYDTGSDLWWAFQYYDYNEPNYDGVKALYYAFAGTDFIEENTTSTFKVNAYTFIHEFGHLMGLDDLYDYDEKTGPSGGLGGADIMDYTVGDHNAFNKMSLGWISPIVISDTSTIQLKDFQTSGQTLVIKKNFTTIFDEIFVVELYTPENLQRLDKVMGEDMGVRILHVDARFNYNSKGEHEYNSGDYQSAFIYDNSDEQYKFIEILEANGDTNSLDIRGGNLADTNDLFKTPTNIFGVTRYANYKTHQGYNLDFNLVVNSLDQLNKTCSITVTFK